MPAASSSRSLMPPSLAAPAPRRPSSRDRTWCESAPVQQLQLGRGPNDEPVASAVRTLGQPVAVVLATTVQARQPVSYTHLRAHETRHDLVCRLLLEKK